MKHKIIFVNTMGVLTNDVFYKNNGDALQKNQLSEHLVKLFKNVVKDYNLKIVFIETWMEDQQTLINSLKQAGFKEIDDYLHSFVKVPLNANKEKSEAIYKVIAAENKEYIILDNNTQLDNYNGEHRAKAIFTNIALGLVSSDLLELRKQIES